MSDDTQLSRATEVTQAANPRTVNYMLRFSTGIQPATQQIGEHVEEGKGNTEPPPSASDKYNEGGVKPTVSARKLAANRQNAKHSSGPKTERGKSNSSKNAIKHGIFAEKLFNHTQQAERLEYDEMAAQLIAHYQPIGFKEQLLVEQIFTQLVRAGRILRYEQLVLSDGASFMGAALEKVLRYSTSHSRELSRLLEELEDEQSKRKS